MDEQITKAEELAAEARKTGGLQGITYALTALVHLGIAYLKKEQP